MTTNTRTVTLRLRRAWWLTPYFWMVAAMCAITGCEPNMERVTYWVNKALSVEIEG